VARSIEVPVISVSERMTAIAVYVGEQKYRLDPIPRLLDGANQALRALERYRSRLDEVSSNLSALEIEDLVTVRDVVQVLQRTEMVRRIAAEVEGFVVELGEDGRLVRLHLDELYSGVEDDRRLVLQDYFHEDAGWHLEEAMAGLSSLDTDHLLDFKSVAAVLHLPLDADDLDASVEPRGHRLLSKVPRLPESVVDGIVEHMGSLQKIMRATIADLVNVEGVGETRARAIKEGLNRLAETSILDRYG
jgi:diadenylate cyclase